MQTQAMLFIRGAHPTPSASALYATSLAGGGSEKPETAVVELLTPRPASAWRGEEPGRVQAGRTREAESTFVAGHRQGLETFPGKY